MRCLNRRHPYKINGLLGLLFCDQAVALLQLEGESATLATRYLRIILPVIPLMMLEIVGIACLRGAGDMMAGLAVMALVNVFNIVVSWSLVLGLGPMPQLGWDGIAVGCCVSEFPAAPM